MVDGKFESFQHERFFNEVNGCTIMKDQIQYIVPLSILGKVFDSFVLKK
jgi:ligand-binding SRPBCC domain-containing protein